MAIKHYDNPLIGKFDYDDTEFAIQDINGSEHLKYIGNEVDGSKIKVPEGLVDGTHLFSASLLETPPVLPSSLKSCVSMFQNCESLKEAPVIPEGVKFCRAMFGGCSSLTKAADVPDSVEYCEFMYSKCSSLVEPPKITVTSSHPKDCGNMFRDSGRLESMPILSDGITSCNYMFSQCKSLKNVTKVPGTAKNCEFMFKGCESMMQPPELGEGLECCDYMFVGCDNLQSPPSLPSTISQCRYMFSNCKSMNGEVNIPNDCVACDAMFTKCKGLTIPPKFPTMNNQGDTPKCTRLTGMFSGCVSLENAPEIPDYVIDCSSMFNGCLGLRNVGRLSAGLQCANYMFQRCITLSSAPVIPKSVVSATSMFNQCSNSVFVAGDWNLSHRGLKYFAHPDDIIDKEYPSFDSKQMDTDTKIAFANCIDRYNDSKSVHFKNLMNGVAEGVFAKYTEIESEYNTTDAYVTHQSMHSHRPDFNSDFDFDYIKQPKSDMSKGLGE